MAAAAQAVPLPLHPDLRLLDEPGRTVVFGADHHEAAHRSVRALAADIRGWVETWSEDLKPFIWHKSADEILQRLAGYCAAINRK